MESFFSTSLEARLARLLTESPAQAALNLFHSAAAAVPAYRDFLKREGVDPARIQTEADFQKLPLLTKQNYILAYPLPQRCRHLAQKGDPITLITPGNNKNEIFRVIEALGSHFEQGVDWKRYRIKLIFAGEIFSEEWRAHPEAARELFGESRLPTLVQYDPLSRFFEVTPEVTLKPMGDPESFPVGVKHRYTRK